VTNYMADYLANDLRPMALDALRRGYAAERDRVRALDAARQADAARVERLLASRPGWQKTAHVGVQAGGSAQASAQWRRTLLLGQAHSHLTQDQRVEMGDQGAHIQTQRVGQCPATTSSRVPKRPQGCS
jgi:hypothetical protein